MNVCPSTDALQEMILGTLSHESAESIRSHVHDCEFCIQILNKLSDDPDLDSWMEDGLGAIKDSTRRAAIDGYRRTREEIAPSWPADLKALGPYEIEAEIGRGGMGVVYRVHDRAINRVVALKILRPEATNTAARQRFVREIQAAARVEHDNIVRVYATSNPDDMILYFTMEYLAGPSLAQFIRSEKRLNSRYAAEVISQVADGLAAAHAAGLVHRDVKPDNILLDPISGRPKISDFGLARLATEWEGLTQDGSIVGTPAYLSPEQAQGVTEIGELSDVYALGVTLYECLAGETPFRGAPHLIIQQILNDDPRPPRSFNDLIPRDLETVCLKAMAKEPHHRYQSCAEFGDDLRRWLNGEPIRARSIGVVGRFWRVCRRYPRVTSLAAALIAAMIAGSTGVFWQWRRAEQNSNQARAYFSRSLDSIDEYFVRVSENRLLNVPNLQPLRKELLEAARDYYQGLLRDRPNDIKLRTELAKARNRLAMVESQIGTFDVSLAQLKESLAEFDRIIAESPNDLAARYSRRTCLVNLAGVLLINSKLDDCKPVYERILADCEQLHRARPKDVEPLEGMYAAYHGLGRIASVRGAQLSQVIDLFERALKTNRDLLAIQPNNPTYLRNTSRTAGLLVEPYYGQNRHADGRRVFNDGYNATKRLVDEHPESLDYRFALATYERQIGTEAIVQSANLTGAAANAKIDEARQAFDSAVNIDRGLVKDNPQVGTYRFDLISMLNYAAMTEYACGRTEKTLAHLNEAHALFEDGTRAKITESWTKVEMVKIMCVASFVHSQEGRFDKALEALDEGAAIYESVSDQDRAQIASFKYAEFLLDSQRAMVLSEMGRIADALPRWDASLKNTPAAAKPIIEYMRDTFRAALRHTALPTPAQALAPIPAADMMSTAPLAGMTNVALARLYANGSMAETDSATRELFKARAVLRLEKARECGYFRNTANLDRLNSDPTLKPLRDRADYEAFRNHATKSLADDPS